MLNFDDFEVLTFDCYGTLINWDAGILGALAPVLEAHDIDIADAELLDLYAEIEYGMESTAYDEYKMVLKNVMRGIGERLNFTPSDEELHHFSNSIIDWQPFLDTVVALHALERRYRLVIISNTDDDIFAATARHLKTEFAYVITAQQVKSYKPSLNNFHEALSRIGLPKERVLHVAQSVFHDIIPANKIGLRTVWVNRRGEANVWLQDEPQAAQPTMEVPDLRSLARLAGLM